MKTVYLDNAATTQVDKQVVKEMAVYFTSKYGNASSIHHKGEEAKKALENARSIIAKSINANPEEIIFTSGGTEANNMAIKEIAFLNVRDTKGFSEHPKIPNQTQGFFGPEKNHIITSKIEHDCVLNTCKFLEKMGWKVTYLDVDKEGLINLKQLENSITDKTVLVSIIHGNNEIGTIQDLEAIGKICKQKDVYFHTDACQSYMKTEIDVKKQNLTLVTLNAHKIHGPKGIGALYIKKGTKIGALIHGGGQERNLRSGTENIPGIMGFAKAVELMNKKDIEKMKKLREMFISGVEKYGKLNGSRNNGLCNNANIRFEGIEGESIVLMLNEKGICASTGSACSSKSLEPSHVLLAIGLRPEQAHGSIRFSLGKFNNEKEIHKVLKELPIIVNKLREMSPF